ncbi:hypothetical protein R3P38DRAFT_3213818 [Favolaschia claudopus]
MDSMDSVLAVLEAVHGDSPTCHYGREATVAAIAPFSAQNYHGLPIVQTQTCKSERGAGFASLLSSIMEQWELNAADNGDIWVLGIDGDAVFREGAFKVLMSHRVDESNPLFPVLGGLKGLNLQCGKNGAVSGSDTKHTVKRVATSYRSPEGVVCERVILNRGIITQWLERLPSQTSESVAILVDPADHQNVPRAYKLIRACISLGSESNSPLESVSPTDHSTRRAFAMAGEMWRSFLDPFTDGSLSLSQALADLSKFAHLAFYFYRQHGSSFLSNQLYADLQTIVKAAFFCVARQKNLDPTRAFYLYQIGSDRLEEMFAEVRTESHDSNVDSLQLSERLSSAADSVQIWNEHSEWHQGHIRRSWSGKEADHVNPTYFTGDMIVGHVDIRKCWTQGARSADDFLSQHGVDFDFDEVLSAPGVDFLCPNGVNYPGISREKDRSIIEDTSADSLSVGTNPAPPDLQTTDNNTDSEPFLPEDDAPVVFLEDFLPDTPSPAPAAASNSPASDPGFSKSTDWLDFPLENGSTKRLHKASILSTLFNSDFKRLATTRLLRVRCYTTDGHKPALNHIEISGEHSFNVGDPAVALIRSHNTVAAAVVRVTVLEKNKARVGQVDIEELGCPDSAITATVQPLVMRDIYVAGGGGIESTRKWVWNGDFVQFDPLNGSASKVESGTRKSLTAKLPGSLLHPLDPEVESINVFSHIEHNTMRGKNFTQTWAVSTTDLGAVVSAMYEGLDATSLLQILPKHGKSELFPYLHSNGSAALVLHNATQILSQQQRDASQRVLCFQCRIEIKGDDARAHVGAHIIRAIHGIKESLLHEEVVLPNPCGFCGRAGCLVDIEKNGQTLKATSACSRQHTFTYGHAKKYSAATPSTNVPIFCALCPIVPPRKLPPVFWKYSIYSHIRDAHPRQWDCEANMACNLDRDFAWNIAISREELIAFNIAAGLSSAPTAKAIAEATSRGKKRVLADVSNMEAGNSNKRAKK